MSYINPTAPVIKFPQSTVISPWVIAKRLKEAEDKLIEITTEHHRSAHKSHGKPRDWRKCWNPLCLEVRIVLGEEISPRKIKRNDYERKREIRIKLKELRQLEKDSKKDGIRQGILGTKSETGNIP